MPMFEFIAKNVGVRRSKGEYVLVTNPDLLFTNHLIAEMAGELSPNRLYRTDRYDFTGQVPLGSSPRKALSFAKRHITHVNVRAAAGKGIPIHIDPWKKRWACLSGRWPSTLALVEEEVNRVSRNGAVVLNKDEQTGGSVHSNASGDYLLCHRDNWDRIKGFAEYTDTFTHLDSYGCYQLIALGLEQILLTPPSMLLHAEHPRTHVNSRPKFESTRAEEDQQRILRGELGPAINDDGWGLADLTLPEEVVT